MHDGMPYDPIQGQVKVTGASEVPKSALFTIYLAQEKSTVSPAWD